MAACSLPPPTTAPSVSTRTRTDAAASSTAVALHHRFEYRNPVESLVWLSDALLCLSPREDNYLHLVDASELAPRSRRST